MKALAQFCVFFTLAMVSAQEFEYDVNAWNQAARFLQSTMNTSANSCDNFSEFACGSYGDPNNPEYQRVLGEKATANAATLQKAIAKVDPKNPKVPKYKKAIKDFYDHCTKESIGKDSTKRMYDTVAQRLGQHPLIGPLPNQYNIWRTIGLSVRKAQVALGVSASVAKPVGYKTGTSSPVLLIESSSFEKAKMSTSGVKTTIYALANATGKTLVEKDVDDLTDRIRALLGALADIPSGSGVFSPFCSSLPNITTTYPFLKDFFEGLLEERLWAAWSTAPDAVVCIESESRLKKFAAVTKDTTHKPEAWQALIFLRNIRSLQLQTSLDDTLDAILELDPATVGILCAQFAQYFFAAGAVRLHFDYIGENVGNWRSEIQLIARNVFAAFRFLFNSADWLDEGEKVKLLEKLNIVQVDPGLPDWITDDEKVSEYTEAYNETQSLYDNQLTVKQKQFDRDAWQLVNGPHQDDPPPKLEVNAFYNPLEKKVIMRLGIIMPPFYQPTYPLAIRYGGLGFVFGHELGHAFDANNVQDGPSYDKPWLKRSTLDSYEKRKACVIRQYDQYCYKVNGLCLNGTLAIGDNTADIDGMKAAYLAYKYVSRIVGGDVPVPQMVGYNSDQLFFLSAVRPWCTRQEPPLDVLEQDPEHSPDRARMEICLRNVPQFAAAFGCKTGTAAVPATRCPIWGDFPRESYDKTNASKGKVGDTAVPKQRQ